MPTRETSGRRLAFALAFAVPTGCYQGVDPRAQADDSAGTDSDGSDDDDDDDDDGSDGGDDGSPAAACGPIPTPLRRMTRRQYLNTVIDLFHPSDLETIELALPADAALGRFDNEASLQVPSDALIEGYQRAALILTSSLFTDAAQTEDVLGGPVPNDAAAQRSLAEQAVTSWGRRLLRRPLTDAEQAGYLDLYDASYEDTGAPQDDFAVALAPVFQSMLQSPQFLYFIEHGEDENAAEPGDWIALGDYELATRLSYFLWESTPDDELLDVADAGLLREPDELEAQVRRLLDHPRAGRVMASFHSQWLHFDRILGQARDYDAYPSWSPEVFEAARDQLDAFIQLTMVDGDGTLESLLTSRTYPVNEALADVLELDVADVPGELWQHVEQDPSRRAGVLTLPGFLGGHAHAVDPSPVQRGVFVLEQLQCHHLPDPPPDVDQAIPDSDPSEPRTNRERYSAALDQPACASCHQLINPIGFTFEHYDAVGAYRTHDNGFPVDASSEGVADAIELAESLVEDHAVNNCVARQWFQFGFAQPIATDSGLCAVNELTTLLEDSGGDVRELVVSIALAKPFTHRQIPEDAQ